MADFKCKAEELQGSRLAIVSRDGKNVIPFAELEFTPYKTEKGREGFNLLRLGSRFEGEVVGRTVDGYSINLKGGMYAKKLLDKPIVESIRAGKVL